MPRRGSLVAAALSAARCALDERRLVGTDASDLSALAGARAGTVSATLRTHTKLSSSPSKSGAPGENAAYLKLEKPRFLFLEGSGGTPRRLSPPPPRSPTPPWCSPALLQCVRPPLLTARRQAPPRPPRAPTPPPPLRPLAAGAEDSTSRGGRPPRSPLPPPRPTTSSPGSLGERFPAARAAGTPHLAAPGAPAAKVSSPSYAPLFLALATARRGRPPGHEVLEDPSARRPRSPFANGIHQNHSGTPRGTERKGEAYLPAGRWKT
jgi:hypothetical protein